MAAGASPRPPAAEGRCPSPEQKEMLEDHKRTGAYYQAVMSNKRQFQGKVVLDVGTGAPSPAAHDGAARPRARACLAVSDARRAAPHRLRHPRHVRGQGRRQQGLRCRGHQHGHQRTQADRAQQGAAAAWGLLLHGGRLHGDCCMWAGCMGAGCCMHLSCCPHRQAADGLPAELQACAFASRCASP